MQINKKIGSLLIMGAIAVFIPYTVLTIIFEYPDILRQDTATIVTKLNEGGISPIWTLFAFAIMGLPLLLAYSMISQSLDRHA